MFETTFISNKTRRELIKYSFVTVFAIFLWILQISIFSRILIFDISPNVIFLGSIFSGIALGSTYGFVFGAISSFLSANILYDHTFYISFPIIGLLSGLLVKSNLADEMALFILLSCILIFLFELLNGIQYNLRANVNILERYVTCSLSGLAINIILSPVFYWIINILTKKLKLR